MYRTSLLGIGLTETYKSELNTCTIDFKSSSSVGDQAFYFTAEAAELQQHLLSYFSTRVVDQGFIPMKTPDFFKDFVIVRMKLSLIDSPLKATIYINIDLCMRSFLMMQL